MKFLRFLWGFICGIWTLVIAIIGMIIGGTVGYELGNDDRPRRRDYSKPYDYSEHAKRPWQ